MSNIKTCSIIYGYINDCLDDVDQDSPVLIIEPRNEMIDKIKLLKRKDIILIPKILGEMCDSEKFFYFNNKTGVYSLNKQDWDKSIVKTYKGYTISPESIISDYKIQNVKKLIVNLNVTNLEWILDNLYVYNHIISNITINNLNCNSKMLLYYDSQVFETKTEYNHKNLNIKLPNIGLYFLKKTKSNDQHLEQFIHQYKMHIIFSNGDMCNNVISYPSSVQIINEDVHFEISKIYYENVIAILENLFTNNKLQEPPSCIIDNCEDKLLNVDDLDIIIQFNPDYFSTKRTLQIMYPLKNNIIYVNKSYDIMYSTKDCMYMVYQILKSNYFTDYINLKKQERPTLFKVYSKKYFYDYLEKIFVFKQI